MERLGDTNVKNVVTYTTTKPFGAAFEAPDSLLSRVKSVAGSMSPIVKHYGQNAMVGAAGAAVLGAVAQYHWGNSSSTLGRAVSALLGTQRPASSAFLDVVKAYASVVANYSKFGAVGGLGAAFKTPMSDVAEGSVTPSDEEHAKVA